MRKTILFGIGILTSFTLLLMINLSSCKKELGSTDIVVDPERIIGERFIAVAVLDDKTTNEITSYKYKVTYPDGSFIDQIGTSSIFKVDATQNGRYTIIVSQDGYLEGKAIADVALPNDVHTSMLIKRIVVLSKLGPTKKISSITSAEIFEQSNMGIDDNQYFTLELPGGSLNNDVNLSLTLSNPVNIFNGVPLPNIDVKGIINTPFMYIHATNKANTQGHINFNNFIDITFPITFNPAEVDANKLYLVYVKEDGSIDSENPEPIPFVIEQTRAKFRGRAKIRNFSVIAGVNGYSCIEDITTISSKSLSSSCGNSLTISEQLIGYQPTKSNNFDTKAANGGFNNIIDLYNTAVNRFNANGIFSYNKTIPAAENKQILFKFDFILRNYEILKNSLPFPTPAKAKFPDVLTITDQSVGCHVQ